MNLQLKVSDLVHSEEVKRKLASEQVNKGVGGTNTWCNETKEVVLRFRDEYFIALMSYSFQLQSQEWILMYIQICLLGVGSERGAWWDCNRILSS